MSLPSNEKGFKDKLYWTRDQAHPAAAAAARAARRTPLTPLPASRCTSYPNPYPYP